VGKPTGFIEIARELPTRRPAKERVRDFLEVYNPFPDDKLRAQGARCMDCGVPFCHQGCPLGNLIPDWNDLVYRDQWRMAIERLHSTNNFPEFTGKLCPAPCEASCVLGINNDPVAIKQVEAGIIDKAWNEGWVVAQPPAVLTDKKIAIVGSGPAGLACAQQLARAGHSVTVFERADRIGGLLRYGIPDFKMEKRFLDRRLEQMTAEGVVFRPSTNIGVDVRAQELLARFDAICLCGGSTQPRNLPIEGRDLQGVTFAMQYLTGQNRRGAGDLVDDKDFISARDKHVVIIGGGDTGADCLGTVHRQKCKSVYQFEIVPRPPENRAAANPWPQWSNIFRTSSAHEEGGLREFSIMTKRFVGKNGRVKSLETVQVELELQNGRPQFVEQPGTEKSYRADLVLLAMGFAGPERSGMLEQFGVELDTSGNVKSDASKHTSVSKVFTAGDMTRGQSLIVWAIAEGRHAAHAVDRYLMGSSDLPAPLEHGNRLRPFA
jgi:glutamate synthase (NADPH/NADH) small chain